MHKDYADYLVKKTQEDYNTIAEEFDRTRDHLWGGMEAFADLVKAGDRVLDFGCGNGRLLGLFRGKGVDYTGVDQADVLVERATAKYHDARFLTVAGPKLPFPDASFDAVFAIAALHHIPSLAKREALLDEFLRILKPEGALVVTVWNLWQKKYFPLMVKYALKKLAGQSPLDFKDVFVPWKDERRAVLARRYYHCFTRGELCSLVRQAGFRVTETGLFGGPKKRFNLYILAKK